MQRKSVTIKAQSSQKAYWQELWDSRQLLWILSKRDITVRYKQTALGVSWSVLRPALTTAVMVFAFHIVAKLKPPGNIPYPLMVLGGITIWTFFSNTLTQISNSVLINSNLVSKVYFPRLIMPLSAVAVAMVDFLVAFGLFILLCIYYSYLPSVNLIYLPFILFLTFLASFSFGLFFATLNVRFRDVGQIIPFFVQVGIYASPIAWSSQQISGSSWYPLYYILNPVAGLIDGFRWCTLGDDAFFDPNSLISTVGISLVALVFSVSYFRRKEGSFVDHI